MQHKARKNIIFNENYFEKLERYFQIQTELRLSVSKIRIFLPGVQVYPGNEGYFWHVLFNVAHLLFLVQNATAYKK